MIISINIFSSPWKRPPRHRIHSTLLLYYIYLSCIIDTHGWCCAEKYWKILIWPKSQPALQWALAFRMRMRVSPILPHIARTRLHILAGTAWKN